MKIGLLGGSFDPFHIGHEALIKGAINDGNMDCVIVIPSCRNPFKPGKSLSAAPYRFYMTKNAVESNKEFNGKVFVSDIEYSYPGISYTLTTIKEISKQTYIRTFLESKGIDSTIANDNHKFFWICGSDILPSFEKWHEPEKILELCTLLVASRPGDGIDIEFEKDRLTSVLGIKPNIFEFQINGFVAASSDIRVTKDYSLVPEVVKEFILTNALYGDENPIDYVSSDCAHMFYENAVKLYKYLGEKRLLHTLNVALLSCHYAHVYEAELCDKALIAGELHDCAKELDEQLQWEMAREYSGDTFNHKKLIHSPAGALFAQQEFDINDPAILDAIAYHTTGRGDMEELDKFVYVADKLEPARTYADLSKEREIAESDLDESIRLIIGSVKRKFESRGQDVHPLTFDFINSLGV